MSRHLFTRDEVKDNFDCVVSLAVDGGLWSGDVAQVVAALGAGFGLRLDLPAATRATVVEMLPEPVGSVNAEAARLLTALLQLARKVEVES